jgi:hypothetical protein
MKVCEFLNVKVLSLVEIPVISYDKAAYNACEQRLSTNRVSYLL